MPGLRCLDTIRHPGELNRLLLEIRKLANQKGRANLRRVAQALEAQSFLAGPVPFDDLLDLALHFRLVHPRDDTVSITPAGENFLGANPEEEYSITDGQQHLLVTSILLGRTELSGQFALILGEFTYSPEANRYQAAGTSSSGRLPALGIRLLCSAIDFLSEDQQGVRFLNPNFNTDIARRIRIARHVEWEGRTPTDLDLARSEHAEELIYNDEKRRLEELGFPELSRKVQMICAFNSAAGFDVQSFDGPGSRVEVPDQFLEVKSSTGAAFQFVLTRNELRKARELRAKYRIDFLGDHDVGKRLEDCRRETLVDPFDLIFDDERFTVDAAKFRVTERGVEFKQD